MVLTCLKCPWIQCFQGIIRFWLDFYCKKLLHKDGKVFLCSDNAEYQPIEVHDGDTLIVYGKIVKVLC